MQSTTQTISNQISARQSRIIKIGIRGKLLAGFSAIICIMLIAISIMLVKITTSEHAAARVINVEMPAYNAIMEFNKEVHHITSATQSWLITHDEKYRNETIYGWKNINELIALMDGLSTNYSVDKREQWQNAKALLADLQTAYEKVMRNSDTQAAITQLNTDILPITGKIFDILDGRLNANGQRLDGFQEQFYLLLSMGGEEINHNMDVLRIIAYVSLIACILAAILIVVVTTRKILGPLTNAMVATRHIAAGDLTQRVAIESDDELGKLGQDLNAMTEGLATITRKITEASQNMVATLEEVRHAVDAQSSGTSEQASAIHEITSSLEEIEKSSKQTMDKAKTLGKLAETTQEKGQLGLQSVEESISGMKVVRDKVQMIAQTILDLSNQTQQVGEITAVVNRLAQQSSMLALNASIEAAKAGEAGKGFSVVAVEVKNLAEQSEQSTAQVQKILEDIRHATEKAVLVTEEGTKGVDHGTNLVEQTGVIVHGLNETIHETMLASQHIVAAVRQESVGIEQITAGMNEINQVTTAFVSSVQQTIQAISHLASIVNTLKEHIAIYKIQ